MSVSPKIGYLFEYVKLDGDVHFLCFDLFLQILSKKSIWHFAVTWLISPVYSLKLEASGFSWSNWNKLHWNNLTYHSRIFNSHLRLGNLDLYKWAQFDIIRKPSVSQQTMMDRLLQDLCSDFANRMSLTKF